MKAIYKRELKSYFDSMIGYVFIAFLVAITGIYFMVYNLNMGYPYFFLCAKLNTFYYAGGSPGTYDEMLCGGEEKQNRSTSFDSSGKS